MSKLEKIIKVARGIEKADLVIKNGNIINVLSEEIHKGDIAIKGNLIAGIGEDYQGEKEIDVNGAYVTPSWYTSRDCREYGSSGG